MICRSHLFRCTKGTHRPIAVCFFYIDLSVNKTFLRIANHREGLRSSLTLFTNSKEIIVFMGARDKAPSTTIHMKIESMCCRCYCRFGPCFKCVDTAADCATIGRINNNASTEHYRQSPCFGITPVMTNMHTYRNAIDIKFLESIPMPKFRFAGMNLGMSGDNVPVWIVDTGSVESRQWFPVTGFSSPDREAHYQIRGILGLV